MVRFSGRRSWRGGFTPRVKRKTNGINYIIIRTGFEAAIAGEREWLAGEAGVACVLISNTYWYFFLGLGLGLG
jgi:hypothetical protein